MLNVHLMTKYSLLSMLALPFPDPLLPGWLLIERNQCKDYKFVFCHEMHITHDFPNDVGSVTK